MHKKIVLHYKKNATKIWESLQVQAIQYVRVSGPCQVTATYLATRFAGSGNS